MYTIFKSSINVFTCVSQSLTNMTERAFERKRPVFHGIACVSVRFLVFFFTIIFGQVGEFFPGPSKTTRAYLHTEEAVRTALEAAGFKVKRTEMTSTNFYFSRMLEAVRE